MAVASAFSLGYGQQIETKSIAAGGTLKEASTEFASRHPRLFPGCCAYSFGTYLSEGKMTMPGFIDKVVELGSVGADMTVYWFKSTEPAYLDDLRHAAFKNGVMFSGVACRSIMVQAEAAKRRQVLQEIKKWVDVTDQLGASHLRIFAGVPPSGVTVKEATDWVVETMKHACEYSSKKGVVLGIENHNGITQRSEVCLEIAHRIDSPYNGITLDITNFVSTPTEDAYAQIKACIPYATHAHIRDYFADGTPVDLDRVWRMFAERGYKGYMSAEYDRSYMPTEYPGKKDAMTAVPKLIDKIRTLCRTYSTA